MRFPRLTLRLGLVLSLALNLFLAAALAAPHVLPPPPGRDREARIVERIVERLPAEDRPVFRDAHARHADKLKSEFQAWRQARADARAALAAEPLDAAALERALAESRRASEAIQATMHAVTLEAAPKMSPEGRRGLLPGPRRD